MTDQQMDRALAQRGSRECRTGTAAFDQVFSSAMARGQRAYRQREKASCKKIWALSAVCAGALLLACLWPGQPANDARNGYLPTEKLAGAAVPLSSAVETVTEKSPLIHVSASLSGDTVALKAAWSNPTQDIWLVSWEPLFRYQWTEGEEIQAPAELVWLEPGTRYEETVLWRGADPPGENDTMGYAYRGYRVSADMLFWIDALLPPEDEGYAEQQSLLQDALSAGALLIAPQEWANGQAGEMTLALPESYLAAHPGQTALEYCLENGLLDAESAAACAGVRYLSLTR